MAQLQVQKCDHDVRPLEVYAVQISADYVEIHCATCDGLLETVDA